MSYKNLPLPYYVENITAHIFNPLSPNINMLILHSVLYIFHVVLVGRICTNIKTVQSCMVIISFILVSCMFDQVGIL